ncbi:MAG TPA: outer membrane lipid asymmetry maintenance protein MlaD [Tepidisphaeraceae bacterium]|jgi:phospholipid/cholesterol/gamma-HCH transport system substrate-binding protein|nr:outer membrane lipid asymmetry maintenance protein MlaD [Tepidisphaeraceae bacterium]
MDRSPLRDFFVGLFVLAALASIAYLSISIGGFTWRQHGGLELSAGFDEIGGLTVRAPVVIAGVRVGEISDISLDSNYRALVQMDLDSALKLPTDTSASIVTSGVLGDRYVELQPGGEDTMLKSGDRITFTESAVILERLIGQLVYGITKGGASDNKPQLPTTRTGNTQ